ncbi:MAG: BMP family ABC transporter substrate-binding protein [Spirochaetae bacterium HGW-Spirochaetae-3]|nr:MAG: BMP family ABC transporter substrate-binding protein [Spirochaetae bacterium HGW-Spirochaetae-3]
MQHIRPLAAALACILSLASCGSRAPREAERRPASPVDIPSIGLVFDVGGRDDASFNRSAYDGLVMLARDVNGYIRDDADADFGFKLDIRVLESKHRGADREQLLRSLAEEGRDLVIAVGFLFADSISSVAKDYPRTHFALIDGTVPDLDAGSTVTCVGFAENEGSFLVGAYAGLIAAAAGPDAKVGFVGGMDTPLIRRFLSGYAAGAAYANPALRAPGRVVSAFVARDASGFDDPARGAEMASMLFRVKSAVVYHAAGASGRGVFDAATRFGAKAIGVDSDQAAILAASDAQSDAVLSKVIVTSMLKRVDRAIYALGQELVSGIPIAGGYRTFGLAEGGVGYVAAGLPDDAVTLLSDLARRVSSGDISVPADDQALADFIAMLR